MKLRTVERRLYERVVFSERDTFAYRLSV